MSRHEGGCLCGALRFAVSADPMRVTVCHCRFCQRTTGTAYLVEPVFLKTQFQITSGTPRTWDTVSAGSGKRVTIHFCATCDGPFYKGSEELLVLGGGNSGLEEGLFLAQFTDKVTVVEYKDRLAGSQLLQDKVAADPKMNVLLNRKVTSFSPKDDGSGKIGTVVLENVQTGETEEHHPAGVFVFVGLDPNTGFLDGTVDLDERGFILTDDTFMTSLPGVFAAGDVRVGSTKQLASAVGEGAAVAIQIRGYLDRQLDEAVHTGV